MRIELGDAISETRFEDLEKGDVFQVMKHHEECNIGPYMKCAGKATCINLKIGYTFDFIKEFGTLSTLSKIGVKLVRDDI